MSFGPPKRRDILPGVAPEQARTWTLEAFRPATRTAEERGVVICLEPLAPSETNFLNTAAETRSLADAMGSPALQIMLDVKAMCSEGRPVAETIEAFAGRDHRGLCWAILVLPRQRREPEGPRFREHRLPTHRPSPAQYGLPRLGLGRGLPLRRGPGSHRHPQPGPSEAASGLNPPGKPAPRRIVTPGDHAEPKEPFLMSVPIARVTGVALWFLPVTTRVPLKFGTEALRQRLLHLHLIKLKHLLGLKRHLHH